jgi:regulator of protease activity HflC (stomatin/prohibitin superfamily)
MSLGEKRIIQLTRLLGVAALGFWIWLLLPLATWYVRRIPDKSKNLPFAAWLRTHPERFYAWLSGFLETWFMWSLFWTGLFYGLAIAVWVVDALSIHKLSFLYYNLISMLLYIYLTFIVGTGYLGFSAAKASYWDVFWDQAESGAKILLGEGEYNKLPGAEKELVKRHVVDSEIGISKGRWIVRGGKTHTINPPSGSLAKFGGPGILLVQTGHAVILERKGNQFRIVGEGLHLLETFEKPEVIIPLTNQTARLRVENIITKDGGAIDRIDAMVLYKVYPGRKTRDISSRYPFDEEVIWTAWNTKGENPGDSVGPIASVVLRTIVSKYTLEELFANYSQALEKLRIELIRETNNIVTSELGYLVTVAAIDSAVLPEATKQKLWQTWANERDRVMLIRTTEAEAYALDMLERTRNLVRRDLIEKVRDGLPGGSELPSEELARQSMEIAEKLSKETWLELTSKRQHELLEQLIKSTAPKNIYLQTPQPIGPA